MLFPPSDQYETLQVFCDATRSIPLFVFVHFLLPSAAFPMFPGIFIWWYELGNGPFMVYTTDFVSVKGFL